MAISGNLARVDYAKHALATKDVIQRCPTGAIVWLSESGVSCKGMEAKPVARKTALPPRASFRDVV